MDDSIIMKRFEIVIGTEYLDQLMKLLERSEVHGYTILRNVGGVGTRGVRDPDDVLITDENILMILACKEDKAQKVLNELSMAMKGFGGMCLVSSCRAQIPR